MKPNALVVSMVFSARGKTPAEKNLRFSALLKREEVPPIAEGTSARHGTYGACGAAVGR